MKMLATILQMYAGFSGSEVYVTKAFGVIVNERSNVAANEAHETNVKYVFTAGDMHRGQS